MLLNDAHSRFTKPHQPNKLKVFLATYREDDETFLRICCGGNVGPWTAPSLSLSPPKLVMNSTTPAEGIPGDFERDRDDESLHLKRPHRWIIIFK
jgi:hypothetical protein